MVRMWPARQAAISAARNAIAGPTAGSTQARAGLSASGIRGVSIRITIAWS